VNWPDDYLDRVLCADCLNVLRAMPDNCVDAVVTDPPYGLTDLSLDKVTGVLRAWLNGEKAQVNGHGFMGKSWDAICIGPEVWREVYRVLKPGGHCLVFAGTRTMDLAAVALRLAGFELRDSIGRAHDGGQAPLLAWVQGSGFPKSLDISKQLDRMEYQRREKAIREALAKAGYSEVVWSE